MKETRPGFLEADLVAHCGADIEGGYVYTLTLTDVDTGWTECLPLLHRSQEAVLAALRRARTLFPFPILGIDTDNGGEFINYVYDSAKTPLQRLLQSGVLPAEMQQELLEVAHALDPIRLFEQLEQLQQAVFRCAVGCSPFLSSLPSTPLRVFSVGRCMTGTLPSPGSVPDTAAGAMAR